MSARYTNTHSVKEILARLVERKRFIGRNGGLLLPHTWTTCVGEQVAQHARPLRLSKGTLTLAVESSAWMNELQFYVPEIMERVNEKLGAGKVKEVRMKVGRWEEFEGVAESESIETAPLDESEYESLIKILGKVRDPELKERITQAWKKNRERLHAMARKANESD
jgi:hypothetical protein